MRNAGSSKRQESSPAESGLIDCESDRRRSARASQGVIPQAKNVPASQGVIPQAKSVQVSQGVIPQAKIKTVKMTFVIVLGTTSQCSNC